MSDTLNKVTRRELLNAVVKTTGVRRAEALKTMDATFHLIAEALNEGRSVTIKGFGSFEMRDVPARQKTDPATGDTIERPASRKPRLRMAAAARR